MRPYTLGWIAMAFCCYMTAADWRVGLCLGFAAVGSVMDMHEIRKAVPEES